METKVEDKEILVNTMDPRSMAEDLNSFRNSIKFQTSNLRPPEDIIDTINNLMSRTKIRALTIPDINELMIVLSAYSLYLSTEENRLKAYVLFCEKNIQFIVGQNVRNVEAYGFAEKDSIIRANEPKAYELEKNKLVADTKLTSISFISQKISFLSETLKNLSNERMRANR